MDSYLLHSVECENVRDGGYGAFDSVDFALDFSGRSMIAGSVRLEAEYEILNNTAPLGLGPTLRGERVSTAAEIGAHSFMHSWNTSFQKAGLVENLVEYPRYVAMRTAGTMSNNDLLSASMVAEGRSTSELLQRKICLPKTPVDLGGGAVGAGHLEHRGSGFSGYAANSATAQVTGDNIVRPDFSVKPLICVNNVLSQNSLIGYSSSGQIRLSVNLERDNVALYGPEMTQTGTAYSYKLYNMRITFASVPEVPAQPIQLKSHLCLKSTINSALANVSSKVPAVCNSVAISFIRQDREVANLFKNTELAKLPSVDKVRFMFNDSTNKYISYELKTISEMIKEGSKAMSTGGDKTMVSDSLLNANRGFVIGLDFGSAIDLSNQKFNVQIENSTAIDPFLMFSYYSSILNM